MTDIIYKNESYKIQGAIFEVYKEMGHGFLEAVYQECLEKELLKQKIPFIAHPLLKIVYKGDVLQQTYKPDIICFDKIIVELKVAKSIAPEYKAQVINYLKITNYKLGIIVNFGTHPKVEIVRIVL